MVAGIFRQSRNLFSPGRAAGILFRHDTCDTIRMVPDLGVVAFWAAELGLLSLFLLRADDGDQRYFSSRRGDDRTAEILSRAYHRSSVCAANILISANFWLC